MNGLTMSSGIYYMKFSSRKFYNSLQFIQMNITLSICGPLQMPEYNMYWKVLCQKVNPVLLGFSRRELATEPYFHKFTYDCQEKKDTNWSIYIKLTQKWKETLVTRKTCAVLTACESGLIEAGHSITASRQGEMGLQQANQVMIEYCPQASACQQTETGYVQCSL